MALTITKPLEEHKQEFTTKVNSDSYDKITLVYPIYLQLNIEREPDETAKTIMHTYIDAVRGFANVAKTNITSSTSVADMRSIYATFTANLTTI